MGDKRSIDRYRRKIHDLEEENAKLKTEIASLKNELNTSNNRYEAIRDEFTRATESADAEREFMREAIRDAEDARRGYLKLRDELMDMKKVHQKKISTLISSLNKSAAVINK